MLVVIWSSDTGELHRERIRDFKSGNSPSGPARGWVDTTCKATVSSTTAEVMERRAICLGNVAASVGDVDTRCRTAAIRRDRSP